MDDCISFAVGEPDFNTPPNIIQAAQKALDENKTRYTLNSGIWPLREAIAKSIKKDYSVDFCPEKEVIVTAGGMEALLLAMMAILDPGDEVIMPQPYWTNHPEQAKLCGAVPRFVPVTEDDGFVYNINALERAVNNKTKAILINSPSNPTGSVINKKTMAEIANFAINNDLYVISDDVYFKLIYDGEKFESITAMKEMKARTVVINSFSKSFAMTGWRIGYAAADRNIMENMVKFQENVVSCVNTPTQYAAIEALTGDQTFLKDMLAEYEKRRNVLIGGLNRIPKVTAIMPKGAFYAFVNIQESGLSSSDFAIRLLEDKGIVTVPGTAFGEAGEGFLRMSYATSMQAIETGLERIKDFVKNL